MAAEAKVALLQTAVGSRSLRDWDTHWERLPDAFRDDHPELRRIPGLFRIVLDGETMYICSAIEVRGGIAKGLRRISGPPQTGNSRYGAQMIRAHIEEVAVDILRLNDQTDPKVVGRLLKRAMNKLYDPEWAWAAQRRMKQIRAGERPASR